MPKPEEDTRLLGTPSDGSATHVPSTLSARASYTTVLGDAEGWGKPRHPVDVNLMKRNMSVAKGFIDISLLTANASQLKHLLIYGDASSNIHYIILTGLVLSLILQVATGILLILIERFDINKEEDHDSAELYNNITLGFVFATLAINVFVSSLGVSIVHHHPHQNGGHVKQGTGQSVSLNSRVPPANYSYPFSNTPVDSSG